MDKKMGKYLWKGILKKVVMYAVLILFAMLFLVPFFFLLMGSFKEQSELSGFRSNGFRTVSH